ncbi:MAG: hypothetical protein AB1716_03510 [Planctomycetota bacterium]
MPHCSMRRAWTGCAVLALCAAAAAQPVKVVVDMNLAAPGFQSVVSIPPLVEQRHDIGVFIFDPAGPGSPHTFWSIGFIGGVDRGIAFGHMPDNLPWGGQVDNIEPGVVNPLNPGNTAYLHGDPLLEKAFLGPEVQYIEFGAAQPALIPAVPGRPVFTARVVLRGPQSPKEFPFYLADFVTIWQFGRAGAFSTHASLNTLDTGGDVVPDQTRTRNGTDLDTPQPVPPASFYVDYVDGPITGGGARIRIAPRGDVNCDRRVNFDDINPFVLALTAPAGFAEAFPSCRIDLADCNGDGRVDFDDINPFVALLTGPS